MRTRKEIEKWEEEAGIPGWGRSGEHDWRKLQIEVLLDIRDLLERGMVFNGTALHAPEVTKEV